MNNGEDRMRNVVRHSEALTWESPEPHKRWMTLLFERDITPTQNISAGLVTLPVGQEQSKLSRHPDGEEIYFIVRGRGKFQLDDDYVDVEADTSVYIAPGVGHRAINTGDEEMVLYWVNSPPVFGPVGAYKEVVKDWKQVR